MAMARKCDICGEFYEQISANVYGGEIFIRHVQSKNEVQNKTFDVCPSCVNKLLREQLHQIDEYPEVMTETVEAEVVE